MTTKTEIPSDLNMLSVRALRGIAEELQIKLGSEDTKAVIITKLEAPIEQAIADGKYLREQPQGGQNDAANQPPAPGGDAAAAAQAGDANGDQAGGQTQDQGQNDGQADGTAGDQAQAQPVAAGEPQKAVNPSKYAAIAELLDAGRKVDGFEYLRQVKVAKNLTVTPTDVTKTDPVTGEVWVLCQIKEKHLHATR